MLAEPRNDSCLEHAIAVTRDHLASPPAPHTPECAECMAKQTIPIAAPHAFNGSPHTSLPSPAATGGTGSLGFHRASHPAEARCPVSGKSALSH
jgi:hypothetical protein